MSEYTPELGQALWGHLTKEYEASDILDAALCFLRDRLETVLWNNFQRECPSPFNNSGSRFDTEGLSIHSYSWVDDDQPWNFKCGDIEVSWYKYLGRGMSVNKDLTPSEVSELLKTALAIIDGCDTPNFGDDPATRNFTYE